MYRKINRDQRMICPKQSIEGFLLLLITSPQLWHDPRGKLMRVLTPSSKEKKEEWRRNMRRRRKRKKRKGQRRRNRRDFEKLDIKIVLEL